ncbi:MAG: inositol monophosphatase family protein [Planctomycetota bacterium]|nr:inositol monophosphatase family protein [Planctomycetota bacterium]MDA1177478.1 inositol monophosphatase family protein [Planctomycetota bacterium]
MHATRVAQIAEDAAREAGEVLLSWLGRAEFREKAPADLVTQADLQSQQCIQERFSRELPDFDFLGEESTDSDQPDLSKLTRPVWIVDPLDGTTNFVHGLPAFCVSIALWDARGASVGVIFDPTRDELFCAERGGGAFLNRRRIVPSDCHDLASALVAASFPPRACRGSPEVEQFLNVLPESRAVRRWGSAALNLAYVACGRLDAFWSSSVRAWDVAAGSLLVSEAGGAVSDLVGAPFRINDPQILVAASPQLALQLEKCLQS